MNKEHVLFHIREATEALTNLTAEINSDPDYDSSNFRVDLSHVYHHLNSAWNGRDSVTSWGTSEHESHFDEWRKFPSNDEMIL
jgi:hypothetical protein